MQKINQQAQQFKQNVGSNPGQFQQFGQSGFTLPQQAKVDPTIEATIQDLKTQIGQLATAVNELVQQKSSAIPSQTVVNQKASQE